MEHDLIGSYLLYKILSEATVYPHENKNKFVIQESEGVEDACILLNVTVMWNPKSTLVMLQ